MDSASSSNDAKLRKLISGLNGPGASSRALEIIAVIRRDVLVKKDGARHLREAGGLDRLVYFLRKGSERIQNATLSVLATCCLEDESCIAVGKLNISVPLVLIVKTSAQDSVLGRACRLLGNLAQKPGNAENLHAAGAVSALIALLERRDKNTSYPTLTMLVRAIRLLWMVPEKREEMLTSGAVRAIAVLLSTECETVGLIKPASPNANTQDMRKSQEELLSGLIKCLGYVTTFTSPLCAEQLQGEGRGYQCLVALTKTHESMAVQCLMNLCYVSSCRPMLGTAGVVECLVGILQKLSDVSWWPEGSARALAQLSSESVNRSRLRHCGGLSLLLQAARTSNHALRALLQFVFDDAALQILVDEGLLTFLTEELASYLSTMPYEHEMSEKEDSEGKSPAEENKDSSSDETCQSSKKESLDDDERNVVIERDNMLVGFVDNDSDTEEVAGDDKLKHNKKGKRNLKCQLTRMASQDWSSNLYWEVKSPSPRCSLSPDRGSWASACASPDAGLGARSKRARWDWSPDLGIGSAGGASECGWSDPEPPSPVSVSSRDSGSGLYSPVCSESESEAEGEASAETSEPPAVELNTSIVMQELDDLLMDDDDQDITQLDDSKQEACISSSRIGCILVLWLCVAQNACPDDKTTQPATSENTVRLLTKSDSLIVLVDYLEKSKRPYGRTAKILARILSNTLSLMSVLTSGLAMRLYKMSVVSRHPQDQCRQCRQVICISKMLLLQVTRLAESEYGIGEICYKLHKGPTLLRNSLCLMLPFLVRTPKALLHYFVKCKGLDTLITLTEEASGDISEHVTALARLATNFKIRNPKTVEDNFEDHTLVSYESTDDTKHSDELVIFELDDESTVEANKTFLCENSEVFCAMLTGQFKESTEKRVRLQKATKSGLEYMLALLQYGLNESDCDVRTFPLPELVETSLEALVLADRFLLKHMRTQLRSAVVQFQLSPDNIESVYVWSQTEGMLELWTEAVCYVLVGEMTDEDRVSAFSSVLRLEYRKQWLNDVKALIMQHASPEFRAAFTAS